MRLLQLRTVQLLQESLPTVSDVLSAVFAKSLHMLCLANVVNLAAEIFHHQPLQAHLQYDCNDQIISVQETKSEESLLEVLE